MLRRFYLVVAEKDRTNITFFKSSLSMCTFWQFGQQLCFRTNSLYLEGVTIYFNNPNLQCKLIKNIIENLQGNAKLPKVLFSSKNILKLQEANKYSSACMKLKFFTF